MRVVKNRSETPIPACHVDDDSSPPGLVDRWTTQGESFPVNSIVCSEKSCDSFQYSLGPPCRGVPGRREGAYGMQFFQLNDKPIIVCVFAFDSDCCGILCLTPSLVSYLVDD